MQYVTEYDVINISDTRPRRNMITMGKFDTSNLIMILTWAIDISFQSPELKWVSWTHTTPYILMTKVIERTSSMLDTPPQDKLYRHLQVFNACEHTCIMMIMGGRKMSKTEYGLKAICILPMTYHVILLSQYGCMLTAYPSFIRWTRRYLCTKYRSLRIFVIT